MKMVKGRKREETRCMKKKRERGETYIVTIFLL